MHLSRRRGEFDGLPVELLDGVLVRVPPQGPQHGHAIGSLTEELVLRLRAAVGPSVRVRPQTPLAACDVSEPEPDIAVVDAATDTGAARPSSAQLVVEVTAGTRRADARPAALIRAALTRVPAEGTLGHGRPVPARGRRRAVG
jgi:Uma2 family endonuclease